MSTNIYNKVLLTHKINIDFKLINDNLNKLSNLFEKIIKKEVEGMCINEGFIKPNSVNILSHSSGELYSNYITFTATYECYITNPYESMLIDCKVKSITKVGLRCEIDDVISPFIIFVARDHHYDTELFSKINENDIINVRVIGKRYELYDNYISVIAELIDVNNAETTKNNLKI
jgi:hypothetical protein